MELQSLSTLGDGDKQKEAGVQLLPMPFVQSHVTFESFFAAKILLSMRRHINGHQGPSFCVSLEIISPH